MENMMMVLVIFAKTVFFSVEIVYHNITALLVRIIWFFKSKEMLEFAHVQTEEIIQIPIGVVLVV